MIAIVSLLIVITVSIVLTRVATIALVHTGLSQPTARFQARSAFTGAGFTTNESERVVNHPVRRRIILLLMLLGNAGVVTAVSSLILTFVEQNNSASVALKVVLLVVGLMLLWVIAMSQWVDHHLSRIIDWAIARYTRLDVTDYASLMHLAGEYRLAELEVKPGDWIDGKSLQQSALHDEGILVLGIERPDGTYLGAPQGTTKIHAQDSLIAYGRVSALQALDQRRKDVRGERNRRQAVAEQHRIEQAEEKQDPDRKNDL